MSVTRRLSRLSNLAPLPADYKRPRPDLRGAPTGLRLAPPNRPFDPTDPATYGPVGSGRR